MKKVWTIVAFNHPNEQKSVLYKQKISEEQLIKAVATAIKRGANLMSIRGTKKYGKAV